LAGEFAARFAPVDDGTRLIVAPEALSRFYHASPAERARTGPGTVGATWMTREDRNSEIADQVSYLDAIHRVIFERVAREAVRLTVLGFSQGVATVTRWLTRSKHPVDRLVCWAGTIPEDVRHGLRGLPLTVVVGTRDIYAPPERIAEIKVELDAANLSYRQIEFAGGHRLDDGVLRQLADEEAPAPQIGI